MHPPKLLSASLLFLLPMPLLAATYTVGPSGRQYTQLADVFRNNNLAPGDVVLVDGNATYNGDIVVGSDDAGAPGNPVVIRWRRGPGESRPRLQGGGHTIKFERSNHVVFEGFEVRGGSRSCVFSEAHDVTVRDALITACPSHGILGADQNSGSFTLEYSEISNSGSGTTRHAIYMQSDEVTWPDTVFRMQYNYVHSGTGGVLVRSRHQRSEIYYNWIEGSVYGEMELIGPDCETQKPGWTANLRREDADVVGNVIVHNATWRNAIRMGGDLNGRSQGRVRLVNNTIIFANSGAANAVMVQLGADSLEMHNNVVYQIPSGSTPAIGRENPASEGATPYCGPQGRDPWTTGRKVHGSNNWVQTGAILVPQEFTGTRSGSNPGFVDAAARNLRPTVGSPLIDAGNNAPQTAPAFPFPSPLALPAFDPPLRAKMAVGDHHPRVMHGSRIDIGALEDLEVDDVLTPLPGSQPRVPQSVGGASLEGAGTQVPGADRPVRAEEDGAQPASQSPAVRTEPRNPSIWQSAWFRLVAWWDGLLRLLSR
ncbi:MAG: hypothetical protein GX856_04385 [Gammaproteobacteria bacterium]|nr:hypothetical protein [Gammaproteobacteria bacterium]